jgi:hypothetical protein
LEADQSPFASRPAATPCAPWPPPGCDTFTNADSRREDYTQGESVFYGVFLMVSAGILLCSGLWTVLISLFG